MASLLIFVLVSNLFLTNCQIYLPAPANIQPEDPYSTMEIFKQLQAETNAKPTPEIQIQPPSQDYFSAADYSTPNFDKFLNKYSQPVNEPDNYHPDTESKPSRYYSDYKSKPKKKSFPKKYRARFSKKQRPKINPLNEAEDFSTESLKNKRKIPISFSGPSAQLTNPFSSELSSLRKNHQDYSAGFNEGSSGGFSSPSGLGDGERMQYQMFGMDGPHSYKFGYDTGKGHNRHFRFEERDNEGKIKGHYGFVDQEGKMSMIHYEADPHTGYRAGPYRHPENHHDFDYNHQNGNDYEN